MIEVGTRVTFKYDKRIKYGTVTEIKDGTTRVRWDATGWTVGYSCGEIRATRTGEEAEFIEGKGVVKMS